MASSSIRLIRSQENAVANLDIFKDWMHELGRESEGGKELKDRLPGSKVRMMRSWRTGLSEKCSC